jgi:hypothetical protein
MFSARNQGAKALLLVTVFSMTIGTLASCTQSEDQESPADTALSASEACDGIFTGAAAEHLKHATERDNFYYRESSGNVRPELQVFVDELRQNTEPQDPYCEIYTSPDERTPVANLSAAWGDSNPEEEPPLHDALFESGLLAYTLDGTAFIRFNCPIDVSDSNYITTSFWAYSESEQPADAQHMSIANSASRVIAAELGCLEEANLPEGDPEVITE